MHLAAHLNALEGRPWHEYARGNPMSQNQLANLLRPFGINSNTIRFDDVVVGHGLASDRQGVHARGVRRLGIAISPSGPLSNRHNVTSHGIRRVQRFQSVTSDSAVTDPEIG